MATDEIDHGNEDQGRAPVPVLRRVGDRVRVTDSGFPAGIDIVLSDDGVGVRAWAGDGVSVHGITRHVRIECEVLEMDGDA